jgi:cytochrome c-type biogenesis protein CcmE
MKPRVLVGVVFIIGFTSLLMWNFGNSIGSFVTFYEAEKSGERVHVAGQWDKSKPFGFDNQRMIFSFYMTDENGDSRRVNYNKPKPNNFEDAEGLVVMGHMRNGVFFSDDMLVKCPSKYNDASNLEVTEAPHTRL